MMLETTDDEAIQAVKTIQDKEGGALDSAGNPRIGCKRIGGKFVPLDQLPAFAPDQWRGTTEIYPIEPDPKDPKVKRLQLIDTITDAIKKAAAKPDAERSDDEKRLAKAHPSLKSPPKKDP